MWEMFQVNFGVLFGGLRYVVGAGQGGIVKWPFLGF